MPLAVCKSGPLNLLRVCLLADTDTPEFPAVPGADTRNVLDFSGKHVFVVGGSRGIGASCVEMLARAGASVGFSFISNEEAAKNLEVRTVFHALLPLLRPHPPRVSGPARSQRCCRYGGSPQRVVSEEGAGSAAGFRADVVSQAEMEVAMAASVSKFGRPLDGLVCSAGVFEPTPIAEWNSPYQGKEGTEAEFRRTMDVNVIGTILAVKAALRHWCPVGGSMVIITSTAGQRGSEIYSAYATSKGAQLMFSASAANRRPPLLPTAACQQNLLLCVRIHLTHTGGCAHSQPTNLTCHLYSAFDGEGAGAAAHSCELCSTRLDRDRHG